MSYTSRDIADICSARSARIVRNETVRHLLTDSRNISLTAGVMFIAIKGERHDGHLFLKDLYRRGIRVFLVSRCEEDVLKECPEADFIEVQDTLKALQTLAEHHRSSFRFPVIGITGSNGKTIIKEWLWQILRDNFNIVRSPKSYNSQIGVPLSVWQMDPSHTLGLFEAGISRPGEMIKLVRIIRPDIVVFTNIGSAHDENFSGREEKAREKMRLIEGAKTLVFCKDEPVLAGLHEANTINAFTWSRKTKADLQITKIRKEKNETFIQGIYQNAFTGITIPFTDEASIENAIHCWAVTLTLGCNSEEVLQRFRQLTPVAMRLELKQGVNNCSVINDSYNSDFGGLSVALDFLNQQQQHPRKTVILSDILQSGRSDKELYSDVAALIRSKGVHRFIGIGESLLSQKDLFSDIQSEFYHNTDEFCRTFQPGMFHNETILLKGARSFGFENISKLLQQKAHETVLEIDLGAMVHNLNFVRSRLHPGTLLMVMVKASSYGSGSFEIANVLQFHRVDYLAVAYADEGLELRRAGITLPIMVMSPEEQSFDSMIREGLEPEIYSFRILQMFEEAARKYRQQNPSVPPVGVHIKFDTGMKRLGFEEKDINQLIVRLKNSKDLKVISVFSHLAASDEAEHDEYTRSQIRNFIRMSNELRSHFSYGIMRHILNSSGILRFPDAQFELVRLGIGLYGISPVAEEQKNLRHVSTLRTTISQIRQVEKGETVGYSRKGKADENLTIATVPIGYADGLSRVLSNGKGKMYVNGREAKIIGNVCMDMCMLNVTGIPCKEGDDVIVFDAEHPITEIAKDMGTIPYEVLTHVSPRVKRIYWQE